ncbi:hypothetical protein EA462_00760 [Natrarchaeobius halalkaliphilus]|uniref:Mechanosensitive ion channel family protein n=1 Tax=Natrarchaeobius halalkaliphilus TaxID=1679091 RepID=A0A3N6LSB4_9EURY|nr:hypothetical protein EA462_00760 [Natrarchaeobius halalkaliphilus]
MLAGDVRRSIERSIVDLVELVPLLLVAAAIVLIGVAIGNRVRPLVISTGRRIELDEKVRRTPFDALFSDDQKAVSRTFATITRYYVVIVAFFVAIEWVAFRYTASASWFFSTWAQDLLSYVPPIVVGLIVLFLGFYLASYAADQVRQSPIARGSGVSPALAGVTKGLLYFVVLVIGLETMGVDVTILHTFAQALAYGGGLAAALAIGIAFGWGGKDYVAENIDDWFERSRDVANESPVVTSDDD